MIQQPSTPLKKHVIHYYAPITVVSFNAFRNCALRAIQEQKASELIFLFSSEGGDLNSGFTAYNFIRALPVKTTCINMGTVESIAVMPFLACENRFAVEHSRFLLHSFNWTINSRIDAPRLAEHSNSLAFDAERYAQIFDERTKNSQTPIDVRKHLHGDSLIVDPTTAQAAGMIHSLVHTVDRISQNDIHWWVDVF